MRPENRPRQNKDFVRITDPWPAGRVPAAYDDYSYAEREAIARAISHPARWVPRAEWDKYDHNWYCCLVQSRDEVLEEFHRSRPGRRPWEQPGIPKQELTGPRPRGSGARARAAPRSGIRG